MRRPGLNVEALAVAVLLIRDVGNEVSPLSDCCARLTRWPLEEIQQRRWLPGEVEGDRAAHVVPRHLDDYSGGRHLEDAAVLEVRAGADAVCGRPLRRVVKKGRAITTEAHGEQRSTLLGTTRTHIQRWG